MYKSQVFLYWSPVSPQTWSRFGQIQLWWGETPVFAVCTLVTTCVYWEDTVVIKVQLICVFSCRNSNTLFIPSPYCRQKLSDPSIFFVNLYYNLPEETLALTCGYYWVGGGLWMINSWTEISSRVGLCLCYIPRPRLTLNSSHTNWHAGDAAKMEREVVVVGGEKR